MIAYRQIHELAGKPLSEIIRTEDEWGRLLYAKVTARTGDGAPLCRVCLVGGVMIQAGIDPLEYSCASDQEEALRMPRRVLEMAIKDVVSGFRKYDRDKSMCVTTADVNDSPQMTFATIKEICRRYDERTQGESHDREKHRGDQGVPG